MKKYYLLFLFLIVSGVAHSQDETVGNPVLSTSVSSYTGWTFQGYRNYTGNAEVQNINPSNNTYASGGGNVFFTNNPGTNFQISGFPNIQPDAVSISFSMFGYDTANATNLNELILSASLDSGLTWSNVKYHRFLELFYPPTPWDLFFASFDDSAFHMPVNVGKLMLKFTQTSSTKTFRLDDINVSFISLLSIKLNNFTAQIKNNKTVINWEASTNGNMDVFVVEKSKNGEQFSAIGQQHAIGNGKYVYEYVDGISNNNEKAYYRLKMISANGENSYSKTVMINIGTDNHSLIQSVYPIPAKEAVHLLLSNPNGKVISLSVSDTKGQLRLQKNLTFNYNINNFELNTESLESGVYYLTVSTLESNQTQKIVIRK